MYDKYIVFFGTILLELSESLSEELNELWEKGEKKKESYYVPFYERTLLLQKQFAEKLKTASDVTNVEWIEEPKEEHCEPFTDYSRTAKECLMPFSLLLKIDILLPIGKRKYQLPIAYEPKVSQTFSVIYNGTVFMAFAGIQNNLSESTMLGPEIRESLVRIFDNDIVTPRIISPCPLRMNFYIQSCEETQDDESQLKIYSETVDSNFFKSLNELEDITEFLFYKNNFIVGLFCSISTLQDTIEDIGRQIEYEYDKLRCKFIEYNESKFGHKYINKLYNRIFLLYNLLYDYEQNANKLTKSITYLHNNIREYDASKYIEEYILSELSKEKENPPDILATIGHIEDRLKENNTNNTAVISALIGAIVGAIFGLISNFF